MNCFHTHSTNLQDLLDKLPDYDKVKEVSDVLSVLSDPTRVRILWLLCHTTECVTDIALAINMSSPAVSHHLKLLKEAGIITSKKEGKEMLYTLAKNKNARLIHDLLDNMLEIVCPNLNEPYEE